MSVSEKDKEKFQETIDENTNENQKNDDFSQKMKKIFFGFFQGSREKIASIKNKGENNDGEETAIVNEGSAFKNNESEGNLNLGQTGQASEHFESEEELFLKTNIPGFDDLLIKGIPRGSTILLSGGPGTGKTTFGLHLLSEGAKSGKNCLYMSFEEKEERLIGHMKNYGFPVQELIDSKKLIIKRYDPFSISKSVEALLAEARGELLIEVDKLNKFIPPDFKPDIIIIDSLSAISASFAERKDGYRVYIEQLFRSLEETKATSFLITETFADINKNEGFVEEFLADGIITFYNIRVKQNRIKAVEIIKLRGVDFKKKLVPINIIEGTGMEVYPMEEIFTKNDPTY